MKTHGKREDGGVLFRAGLWGQLEHAGDFLADVSEKSVERGRDVRVAGVRGPSGMPGRGSGGLRGCVGHGCETRRGGWWETGGRGRDASGASLGPLLSWAHAERDPPWRGVTRLARGV